MGPFFGPRPVMGDSVYIDFGDSMVSGGELTGKVTAIDDTTITVDGIPEVIEYMVHVEVV